MKNLLLFLTLAFGWSFASSQSSFIIEDVPGPDISSICAIQYYEGQYYCLSINTEPHSPHRTSTTLFVYDEAGNLVNQYSPGSYGYQFFQFLSISNDKIQLVGSLDTDECSATIVISNFTPSTNTLANVTEHSYCKEDRIVKRMILIEGLDNRLFIEGDLSQRITNDFGNQFFVMEIDSLFNVTTLFDDEPGSMHLSVDFSEKNYVLKDTYVCNFYDQNFNLRKQRSNFLNGYKDDANSFHKPFGHKYILDQVNKDEGEITGQAIRLVDSNLYIKKLAVISPVMGRSQYMTLPRFGGVDILNENTIWTTANYGYSLYADSSYFSITKLDAELNIVCNHFIGFDKLYRINGIKAFENNGAIVFGWEAPKFGSSWSDQVDIYAYKVGENCELVTSNNDSDDISFSISAYPNPGINDLTFSITGFDPATLRVEMINELGQSLFQANDLSNSIQVPEMASGQYFYRILQGEKLLGVGSWVKQ